VLAASWAYAVTLSGGGVMHLGPLSVSSQSARNPLLVAVVCGLLGWAVSLRPGATPPPRRGVRYAMALLALVIGLNLLLQVQPSPPEGVNACLFDLPLRGGFHFFLNCDSPEFLGLAGDPSLVFTHPFRESRPLSFVLPYLVAQPLRLLPTFELLPVNPPHQTAFIAFVVMNLVQMLVALLCFTWAFEAGTGRRGGIELLFSLVMLSANDITKLFMWTPHVQIMNLTVPCVAMYVCFRLLVRGSPLTVRQAVLLGLGLGLCFMTYGAFAIPVICAAAIQLFVYRRWLPAIGVACVALVPSLLWIAFVVAYAGVFHSHEVEVYREFVWMGDCVRAGWDACVPMATKNLLSFFNAAAPILVIPAIGVCLSRACREIWAPAQTPAPPTARALWQAAALTFVVSVLFFAAMGFYVPRLVWPLVPPLLMMIAIDWQALREAQPIVGSLPARVAVAAVCIAHVLILASRYGPYY